MSPLSGGLLLLLFCGVTVFSYEEYPEHYPTYLKNKYDQFVSQAPEYQMDYSGTKTKTHGRKTFVKTPNSAKKGSYGGYYTPPYFSEGEKDNYNHLKSQYGTFTGGCSQPRPPVNSNLQCTQDSCNATCMEGYRFPDGKSKVSMNCVNRVWTVEVPSWQTYGMEQTIPLSCEAICSPPCENNGICYAPNRCNCPDNFSGALCETSERPCFNYPLLPPNSRRTCSSTSCTITCSPGHQFPDGSSIATLKCENGIWVPSRKHWDPFPKCEATCTPPCENGGSCISLNICQCSENYRGPQCQYSVDSCNAKQMQFNGAYNCTGDTDSLSCTLRCPDGIKFEHSPAKLYVCSYETGVFQPQPIPQCVYGSNMKIISPGEPKEKFYETVPYSNISFDSLQNKKNYNPFKDKKPYENNIVDGVNIGSPSYKKDKSREDNLLTIEEHLPSSGTCFTWGGAHYKTFDGVIFSGTSNCGLTLVRDSSDNTFSIIVVNSDGCKTGGSSLKGCHRIVKLFIQDKDYTLTKAEDNDEVPVLLTGKKNKRLPLPGHVTGLRSKLQGQHVVLYVDALGVSVRWDGHQLVQVDLTPAMWNKTEGLCGRMDGDKNNDMVTRDGTAQKSAAAILSSWKVRTLGDECESFPSETNICLLSSISKTTAERARGFCGQLLLTTKFSVCKKVMDIDLLTDACQWDYCACAKDNTAQPSECACQTMNMYVRQCRQMGVHEAELVNWRKQEICPIKCTGGRVYKSCGPAGGLQPSCGDTEVIGKDTAELESCEEGCYCPYGLVLHEGQCIDRSECPCKWRGKSFPPGKQVPKECNTCKCANGQWNCTAVSCGARCSAIGDPHYQTFDGKRYNFMGQCSYYLVKSNNYSVEGDNVACAGAISLAMKFPVNVAAGMPSCTKTVTVRTASGSVIRLKQNREVTVNEKEIQQLPYYLNDVVIRMASSMFVILELENELEIWWDGITRVYINIPASFRDTTKGLCGTFNSNQKDDFLTPEGDIEQAIIPFANKWKVDERCEDIKTTTHSLDHPCKVNVYNKAKAEEECGVILSDLFSKCHWLLDPQPFYDDCLYDMCSCEAKVSRCLCPIVAAYAQDCAALGNIIEWRQEVKHCGVQCPGGGQVYQTCSNSCTRSCFDIRDKPYCRKQCVEGCNCPDGQTLNEFGDCIPVEQCSCKADGLQFPAGYKEIRPATLAQELCVCTNALWLCRQATKEEVLMYPKSFERKTVCSATKNQEFTTCEPAVPTTCRNMHDQSALEFSTAICRPGCKCKPGFVLQSALGGHGICIKPEECPCHHGGKSYSDGTSVKNDCNNCTCTQGKWSCTDNHCPGICSVWGDSHYKTFDGRIYDYQGQCDYVLVKGSLGKHDGFKITVQSVACGSLGVSCSRSVSISIGDEMFTLVKGKPIPNYTMLKRMSARQTDLYVIVEAEDLGVTLQWDRGTRVYVRAAPRWKGRLKGMCGNYNDDQMDDFQTPSGGISEVSNQIFGDSWKLEPYCPQSVEVIDACALRPERQVWASKKCGILKTNVFAKCHSEVPVDQFLEKCIFDACACDQGGDCECLCTALAAYTQECNLRGVAIHWRSNDLCPIQCDKNCAKYSPCVTTCPRETCDNLLVSSNLGKLCEEESCIEGCAPKECPPGQVYLNSSAVECVPRDTCKPICMELDEVTYSEGDIIEEDDCHKCYCTRTKKVCTGKPCLDPRIAPTQNDNKVKCQSGWTPWMNQDKPKTRKENKRGRKFDIEPLPNALLLNSLPPGGGRCNAENMEEIQCRTVEGHIDPKATGLDVECSLERGLICKADRKNGIRCPDFEIRILCFCEEEPDKKTHAVLSVQKTCDVNTPHKQHETDCHTFYHCAQGSEKNVWVEKTCGPNMWYNPTHMICDWPSNVLEIRPECEALENNVADKRKVAVAVDDSFDVSGTLCPPNYQYSECGTECYRLCLFYTYAVRQKGLCQRGSACEAGCIHEARQLSCPPGMLWRDNSTCVSVSDCVCRSNNGEPIKPGTIFQESKCEFCQCIDNHYTCDRSACETTVAPTFKPIFLQGGPTTVSMLPFDRVQTEIPPENCDKTKYINLLRPEADWPVSDAAFTASSVLNQAHQPWHARAGGKLPKMSARIWSPKVSNSDQYLQVDLGRVEPLYGVIISGNPLYEEYITSFQVLYSQDPSGKNWKYTKTKSGMPQLFRGPVDQTFPVRAMFEVPVEARYIRINPRSWYNEIGVSLDIIGCGEGPLTLTPTPPTAYLGSTITPDTEEMCDEPMGVDNEQLSNNQVTVSSEKIIGQPFYGLKINGSEAWKPLANNPNEWIKFNFLNPRNLTGIITKGGSAGWVSTYKILYSHDDHSWNPVTDNFGTTRMFLGNFDQDTPYKNMLNKPIRAQYLKIVPKLWMNNIQMRIEPLGCFEPYPPVPPSLATKAEQQSSPCNNCPGVDDFDPDEKCKCPEALWWDGSVCISRVQCPCQVGSLFYPVGTIFETEDCSKCLCALGGTSQCEPKQCEPCEKDLRSTVSATCGCICKPCPKDQILCPTSQICLNSSSWCNGVVECPDDEINCEKSVTLEAPISTSKPAALAQCPPVVCPPGFEIQLKESSREESLQKNLSPMFQMYGGRKTKINQKAAKYFELKGKNRVGYQGAKVLARKPVKDSPGIKKQQQQQICVEFVCKPPVDNQLQQCPDPRCPAGYNVVYHEDQTPQSGLELVESEVTCKGYECHPPPVKDDVCIVTGRSFTTFDGTEYKYDICNHVLARDLFSDDWDVSLVRNCSDICTKDLVIRHGSQLVKMFTDLSFEYNGYRYTAEQTGKIGAKNLAFVVSLLGDTLLFVSNHYGFWIMWNKQGNVKLGITEKLIEQVDGLCGFFDKDPKNDKRQPNGKNAHTSVDFGDSWALGDQSHCEERTCPLHIQNKAFKICQAVRDQIFAPCHFAVADLDGWISKCLETACACLEQKKEVAKKRQDKTEDKVVQRCQCTLLESFIVECTTAKPGVSLEDWRMQMECPASCPAPLVYNNCYRRRCEPSCSNLAETDACPTLPNLCFPGCYCPAGLVRKKDKCVTPRECRDCECNVLPQLEYVTFDGSNHTANTNCTYIMAKDRVITEGDKTDFEVYVSNAPCPRNAKKMCTSTLTLLVNDHRISITRGLTQSDDHQVFIDDILLDNLPFDNGWVEISKLPARHINILVPKLQLEFRGYHPTLGASLKVPSYTYGGKMEGICGDCDRNPDNDYMAPDGLPLRQEDLFVDSWRKPEKDKNCVEEEIKECEPVKQEDGSDPCSVLLDADKFGQCHLLLDPSIFLSTCLHDTCGGSAELACSSLETYALGCRSQGLCIDWHTELCPAKECPSGAEYKLCGPACAATCDNPKGCNVGKGMPMEGCFCSEGTVLKNGTECVEERECNACDEEEHYPGDSWNPDACTSCTCENSTKTVRCETMKCSTVDTVCDVGFDAIKIKKSKSDCCEKYACVPASSVKLECTEPKPIPCGEDQIRKLEKRPDGCHDYVCECKPAEECTSLTDLQKGLTNASLPEGMEKVINDSGCCPKEKLICKPELCSKAPICPKYHNSVKQNFTNLEQCCPEYKCLPPSDKCLFTNKFTQADAGGERELSTLESTTVLLEENVTVNDGPCRLCKCQKIYSPSETLYASCTKTECPLLSENPDFKEYILEATPLRGQCCPNPKRVSCKHTDGTVYKPGDKWALDKINKPCTVLECKEIPDGVVLMEHVLTCDDNCKLGSKYVEPKLGSGECCGSCQQVACAIDGEIKNIGEEWKSQDFCTEYKCINDNGTILVSRKQITCPEISEELLKEFKYRSTLIPGECCNNEEPVACLVDEVAHYIGDTWSDPAGDPCVSVTCLHASAGGNDLTHQKTVTTCNPNCRPGWRYKKPNSELCCGECVQVSCVVNGTEYAPGQTWTSDDGCTAFGCARQEDGTLSTTAAQETCPDVTDCPEKNLWQDNCCVKCNISSLSMKSCEAVTIDGNETIGIIMQKSSGHGVCLNVKPIVGFTECQGQCKSGTEFNTKSSMHEAICTCCQALKYIAVSVELICRDDYKFKKHVAVPSACDCKGCVEAAVPSRKSRSANRN